MSQRAVQLSARRLAAQQPTGSLALARFIRPSLSLSQSRQTSDVANPKAAPVSTPASMQILENQRLHRPVAPHLTIYKPQLTWVLSMLNRLTGIALSGPFYLFGIAYLVSPVFGWSITSTAMAAGFAKWPFIAKFLAKCTVAAPFWFHSFNGVRHLVWDMGKQMNNMQVIRTGWAVVGLTGVATLAVALI